MYCTRSFLLCNVHNGCYEHDVLGVAGDKVVERIYYSLSLVSFDLWNKIIVYMCNTVHKLMKTVYSHHSIWSFQSIFSFFLSQVSMVPPPFACNQLGHISLELNNRQTICSFLVSLIFKKQKFKKYGFNSQGLIIFRGPPFFFAKLLFVLRSNLNTTCCWVPRGINSRFCTKTR